MQGGKTNNNDTVTDTVTVTFTQTESYTWEVPASITAGAAAPTEDNVKASNVYIPYGKTLTISITSGLNDGKITLADTASGASSNTVQATVTFEGVSVNAGTTAGGGAKLSVAEPESVTKAGTYSGTLTFTAAVVDQTASN